MLALLLLILALLIIVPIIRAGWAIWRIACAIGMFLVLVVFLFLIAI